MCIYIYIYSERESNTDVHTYKLACIHVYMYMYVHIPTHIYTYICIDLGLYKSISRVGFKFYCNLAKNTPYRYIKSKFQQQVGPSNQYAALISYIDLRHTQHRSEWPDNTTALTYQHPIGHNPDLNTISGHYTNDGHSQKYQQYLQSLYLHNKDTNYTCHACIYTYIYNWFVSEWCLHPFFGLEL